MSKTMVEFLAAVGAFADTRAAEKLKTIECRKSPYKYKRHEWKGFFETAPEGWEECAWCGAKIRNRQGE